MRKYSRFLTVIIFLLGLTGCAQGVTPEATTLIVKSDGQLIHTMVEEFDESLYDKYELQVMIQEEVDDYNATIGTMPDEKGKHGSVALTSLNVTAGVAQVTMQYASSKEYELFNDCFLYVGTLEEAIQAGYLEQKTALISVETGEYQTPGKDTEDLEDYQVVMSNEAFVMRVPDTIQYYSDQLVLIDHKNINGGANEGMAVVVY